MRDRAMRHRQPLTVRANFAWNFAGKAVYAASRALLLILVAKLGTAEMVGQFALAFAITAPVFMLADMDLRSVLATDTGDRLAFGHYVGLRLSTTALAMAAACVLAALQATPQLFLITLFVGAAKAFETMSDMYYGMLQKNERMNRLGISLMLKGLLSLLAMGLVLWLRHSLLEGVAALALAWLALLLFYDIPSCKAYGAVRPLFNIKLLWGLARLSLPLGLVLLFSSLTRNMPNYFVQAYLGSESLGYFSAMLYLLATGSIVANALGQSTNTRLARLFAKGDTRGFVSSLGMSAGFLAAVGACIALVSLIFGRQILTLLYTPEYAAYGGVFAIVMCGACISYVADLTNYAVTSMRRFRIQPLVQGCALLSALLLNRLIVPAGGLSGAAWCVAAVSLLQLGGNVMVLASNVRKKRRESERRTATAEHAVALEAVNGWEALAPETVAGWRDIVACNQCHTPFSDPDWLAVWWKAFGRGREPVFLVLREGCTLAGVLPLVSERKRGAVSVTLMGTPIASHIEPAIRPECMDGAVRCILLYLSGLEGAVLCRLDGIPEGSAFHAAVKSQSKALKLPLAAFATPYYVISAGNAGYEKIYHNKFSSYKLKKERKDDARLAFLGEVRLREMKGQDMEAAFALRDKRWKTKLDTSGFGSREAKAFFADLLETQSRNWRAQALGMYLGNRLIAFHYNFLCNSYSLNYTMAHDDLFGVYSLGNKMTRDNIRSAMESGAAEVDMGIGYEDYKIGWADRSLAVLSFLFSPGNARSRLLMGLGRVKGVAVAWAKRSRRVVLFKRNTLGRIRYCLSFAWLPGACKRAAGSVARNGLPAYLAARLKIQQPKERIPIKPGKEGIGRLPPGMAAAAGPDDADELALLHCLKPDMIMKKFFRRERCFIAKKGVRIAFAAWVADERGCVVIHDFGSDRRVCAREDILHVLADALVGLSKQQRGKTLLELGRGDMAVREAAEGCGLIRARPRSTTDMEPMAMEERDAAT